MSQGPSSGTTKRARVTPRGPNQSEPGAAAAGGTVLPAVRTSKGMPTKPANTGPTEFTKKALVEHQKQLREQRLLLAKLKKENQALREELQSESSQSQTGTGLASSQLVMVSRLSEEAELYVSKIEQERRKIIELDKRSKDYDKRILEGKCASDSLDRFLKDAKQINLTLENRLHSAKTKFGENLIENIHLRKDIDELRFERGHFLQMYTNVETELAAVNAEIERVVAESKLLFDERLQVMQRIAEMKLVSDDEQKSYMAQCRELNAVLQAFEQSEKSLHAGKLMFDVQDHIGAMSPEQEEELQRKIVRGKWQLAKEKALGDVLKDQAVTFEDALTRIQEATGYQHLDDFVSHFIQIEEHNFHRFNYLNSLNIDIDRAQDELSRLKDTVLKLGEQGTTSEETAESADKETRTRLDKLETHAQDLESKSEHVEAVVKELLTSTSRLTQTLGCSITDNFGVEKDSEVTELNLLRWQAALEQKVSELVALHAATFAVQSPPANIDSGGDEPTDLPPSRHLHVPLGPKKGGKMIILSADAAASLPATLATRALIRPPSVKDDDTNQDEADFDLPLGEAALRQRIEAQSQSLLQHNLSFVEPKGKSGGLRNLGEKKPPQGAPIPLSSSFRK